MERYKREDKSSYILGISLTIEALKKVPEYIQKVLVSSKAIKNEQYDKLIELCDKYSIDVEEDDNSINKLSVKENCYGIGVFKKFYKELETNSHIVLYKFSDYGELGTIMRSAVSFNFKDIVIVESDIDYFDPRVVRASMGSLFHLNIKVYKTLDDYLDNYKYNIYPFISKGNRELKTLITKIPYSLIIPQNYKDLDEVYEDGFYLKHINDDEISLSSLSSVVFNHCYRQSVSENCNVHKVLD